MSLVLVLELDTTIDATAEVALDARTATGPRARLLALEGDRVRLLTNRAAPPGAPLCFELVDREETLLFEARTRGCRRSGPDLEQFVLEARLINLSKRARSSLRAVMSRLAPRSSPPATGH